MWERLVGTSGAVSGDAYRSHLPEEGCRGMLPLGRIHLYRDGDRFTIAAYVISRDSSCYGRSGDVPCRQIEYRAMPGTDHRRPLKLPFG